MRESQITTNIAHLSAGRFKSVEFPVPPLDEQRRIVQEVDERLTAISRVEEAIRAQEVRASTLRSSILAAAFSGTLVPQDLSDEPASVLLQRIAVEQARSNDHKPPRTRQRRRKATA